MERIKNLIILLACFVYMPFRGRANKKCSICKRFCVIQMAAMGDMVCTTPLFRAIKKHYPESSVFIVGKKRNAGILNGNSNVDCFLYFDDFWQMVRKLRKLKIDFACIAAPNFKGLAALYLAGVKTVSVPLIRNGYSPYETLSYKILRNVAICVPHRMGHYAPREYLKLLEPADIFTENTTKDLFITKNSEQKVRTFLKNNKISDDEPIIGIAPSAGNKIKKWGANKFAELAKYILDNYKVRIVIIGSKNDKEDVEEMLRLMKGAARVIDASSRFNLDELKVLIARFDMIISVDSGPIYMAEAFSVPTIDIVGPIDEREQPPIGEFNKIVVWKERLKPELYVMNAREYNKDEAKKQVEMIGVNVVKEVFDQLINKIKIKRINRV